LTANVIKFLIENLILDDVRYLFDFQTLRITELDTVRRGAPPRSARYLGTTAD